MNATEEKKMKVFQVEDGGTHWVAARDEADALLVMLAHYGGDDLTAYTGEHEPTVTEYDSTYLEVYLVGEAPPLAENYTPGTLAYAYIPSSEFHLLKRGLICTTEY